MELSSINNIWKKFDADKKSENTEVVYNQGEVSIELKQIRSSNILRLILKTVKSYEKRFKGINFKGIDFIYHSKGGNTFIDIILLDQNLLSPFNGFLSDLISQMNGNEKSDESVQVLFNTLSTWMKLFKSINKKGLSNEEQLGLFGELYFMYKLLSNSKDVEKLIKNWTGPDKSDKDYVFDGCSVEVKATKVNAPVISISSENQLNNTLQTDLFLALYVFDFLPTNGYTLNSLIEKIKNFINDLSLDEKFEEKLESVGYFEDHAEEYEDKCYALRDEKYFIIDNKFPKLIYGEVGEGVHNVSYSIHPSACIDCKVNFDNILMKI